MIKITLSEFCQLAEHDLGLKHLKFHAKITMKRIIEDFNLY